LLALVLKHLFCLNQMIAYSAKIEITAYLNHPLRQK
jgi:hypothetical protein